MLKKKDETLDVFFLCMLSCLQADFKSISIIFIISTIFIVFYFFIVVNSVEQSFWESSDNRFLVVANHVLEELIYEFYLEIGQVETSVVVAVVLISEVQDYFVFFAFVQWVQELVDHAVSQVLHLGMAGHQRIKFERNQVVDI